MTSSDLKVESYEKWSFLCLGQIGIRVLVLIEIEALLISHKS